MRLEFYPDSSDYNYLFVLLNLGAKVSIFLYRCTTFYCSIPVIYTYL